LDFKPKPTMDDMTSLIANVSTHLLSHGITGITEMLGVHNPLDYFNIYEQSISKGFKQRIGIYYAWDDFQKFPLKDYMFDRTQQVFISGIKLFADGSVSGQTAWVDQPYV